MKTYRSLETIQAVQFQGDPIPGVTCHGSAEEVQANGCDASRKNHPHVHTMDTGGMKVLQKGDWVFPVRGGPFGVASDEKFRSHWEVPVHVEAPPATQNDAAVNVLLPTAGVSATVEHIRTIVAEQAAAPVLPEATPTPLVSGQVADGETFSGVAPAVGMDPTEPPVTTSEA